jgi:NRPS condensation-like uncharacterized protein
VRDLLAGIARPAKDAVKQPRHSGPTAGVALDGGRTGAPGLGFCRMRFEPSATAGILGRRVAPATLNDVLLGSLAVAIRRFNDRAGVAPATVSLGMPVDLRPAGWAEGVVSNIVWAASVPIAPEAQSDLVSAQLAAAERTRVIKDQRVRGELVDVPPMIGSWPVGRLHLITRAALARPIAKRLSSRFDTTGLSNLGRFDGSLDFGDAAGPASELWWSPPALTPPGIGIGAVTMNDELFLTVRYTHEQFDAAGGARFARTWRDVLEAERPEQRS